MSKRDDLAPGRYWGSKAALDKAISAFDAFDYRGVLELRSGYLLVAIVDQFRVDLIAYLEHIDGELTKDTPPPLAEEETQ